MPRTLPMRLLILASMLLLHAVALVRPAWAHDHIVERGWLEDPGGRLTWAEARQRLTQPFDGPTINRGYGAGVLWLRLRIDPRAQSAGARDDGDTLVLRMRPVYLDQITVFDPLARGGLAGTVGDRLHPRLDALQGADFLLPIARGEAPRDIWLRVASTSTRQIHVTALSPAALEGVTTRHSLIAGMYLGMATVLLAWGLIHWVVQRESVMAAFAAMQLAAIGYELSSTGMLRLLWPLAWRAETLDVLGSVMSMLAVGAGVLFHASFLREFRPARWASVLLRALLALTPVNLLLFAAGQPTAALQCNMLVVLLAPLAALACALSGRAWSATRAAARPVLGRGVVVAFYVGLVLVLLLASGAGMGWLPASGQTIFISQTQGLVTGVLLMLMLQYRTFMLAQQRQHAMLELEKTTLQVAHEREAREEQEKLLAMLAHEIKTPLATMHLRLDGQARGGRDMLKAMREINQVIDRCVQSLQVGDGRFAARMGTHDLVGIVHDAVSTCAQPERVRTQLPRALPIVTDPQLLFIVLNNLLDNACKYALDDSPLGLRVSLVDDPVRGRVAQLVLTNLPGKAGRPDPAQVFDKYYRAPHAQRLSGTGLGLYLVRSLSHTLGGHIDYQPDERTIRFVLTLPADPSLVPA